MFTPRGPHRGRAGGPRGPRVQARPRTRRRESGDPSEGRVCRGTSRAQGEGWRKERGASHGVKGRDASPLFFQRLMSLLTPDLCTSLEGPPSAPRAPTRSLASLAHSVVVEVPPHHPSARGLRPLSARPVPAGPKCFPEAQGRAWRGAGAARGQTSGREGSPSGRPGTKGGRLRRAGRDVAQKVRVKSLNLCRRGLSLQ